MRRTCFSTPCWGFRLTGGPAARTARPPNSHTEGDTKGSKKRIVPWFAPSRSRRLGAFFLIAARFIRPVDAAAEGECTAAQTPLMPLERCLRLAHPRIIAPAGSSPCLPALRALTRPPP